MESATVSTVLGFSLTYQLNRLHTSLPCAEIYQLAWNTSQGS